MADTDPLYDPLISLRRSYGTSSPVTLTTSAESTEPTDSLALASHLHFTSPDEHSISLETPTRFISSEQPVNLRSIYFAWQKKDVNIPDYIASAEALNEELVSSEQPGRVQNLVFVERLDLITWIEGGQDESEYIKPLEGDVAGASSAAQLASGATGGVSTVPSGAAGARGGKQLDPRLQEIYNLERRMGDRTAYYEGSSLQ